MPIGIASRGAGCILVSSSREGRTSANWQPNTHSSRRHRRAAKEQWTHRLPELFLRQLRDALLRGVSYLLLIISRKFGIAVNQRDRLLRRLDGLLRLQIHLVDVAKIIVGLRRRGIFL